MDSPLTSIIFFCVSFFTITHGNRFEKFIYQPSYGTMDGCYSYQNKDNFFTFDVPLLSPNEDLIHPCCVNDPIVDLCSAFPKREPLFPLDHIHYLIQFYDISLFGIPQIYGYVRFSERLTSYTFCEENNRVDIRYKNNTSFSFKGSMGPSLCTPILSRHRVRWLEPIICFGDWQEWGQLYQECDVTI